MFKRILFALLWFVLFYFLACVLVGGIAGGIAGAGAPDPQSANAAGRIAGAQAVGALRPYIAIATGLLSVVGAALGILPGTRIKRGPSSEA